MKNCHNNSKTFAKKSISIENCRRRQTSDSCNTTCNMQHATSICMCAAKTINIMDIFYISDKARREQEQQETAGNCQQGCGIKHKTISQQLVANIFGIECELYRKGGLQRKRESGDYIGCQMLLGRCHSNIGPDTITMRFKKLTTIQALYQLPHE